MSNFISKRTVKESYIKGFIDRRLKKELHKRAVSFNQERQQPIAVFANDQIGSLIFLHGLYEKEDIADLHNLLLTIGINISESTAIDIGANIGNHSIYFSKYFKKVLCFEPNSRCFDILSANTKNIENIHLFDWGCGSNHKTMELQEDFNNIGRSSAKIDIKSKYIQQIKIKPLDELLDSLENVSLIKIDVEGMEIESLRGARSIIDKFKPVICFEQHKTEFSDDFSETEVIDWLRQNDYRIFTLSQPKSRSKIYQRVHNLKQLLFGVIDERKIYEFKKLPKGNYSMIYAIHASHEFSYNPS